MSWENDAYKPAEIAALIETAGVAKAVLPLHRMATLAMAGADPGFGPQRVLGRVVFAPRLILCAMEGGRLFSGHALVGTVGGSPTLRLHEG